MMNSKLQKVFKLESNEDLFIKATTPPSCGGDSTWKDLAHKGDILINKALDRIFTAQGIINSGSKTQRRAQFHNERTLVEIGRLIGINDCFKPIDSNYWYTNNDNDIKETIESLIGASSQVNDEEIIFKIVHNLYNFALKRNILDVNVIGILNELLQSENYEKIPFVDEDCGGPDHAKNWKSKIDLIYKNVNYSVESDVFSNKKDARRDAALKMLKEIGYFTDAGNDDYKPITKNPNQNIPARATQSLVQEEIIFTKTSQIMTDRKSIQISSNTCESLIDWALRKSEKKPFSMLLLLSARTDDVKGSAWYASIPQGELTMLNVQLGDNHFFEMGLGVSKSKSRKDAARKIIENSKIFEWLENQYGVNRTI